MEDRVSLTITDAHLKLLQRMNVGWVNDEYGAPEIDPKRPYGNSDVEHDILYIIAPESFDDNGNVSQEALQMAADIHKEMRDALQICLMMQEFRVGVYHKRQSWDRRSWERVE